MLTWGKLSKYRSQLYGITALWILIFHIYELCIGQIDFKWIGTNVFNNGNIGVDLFLFLSGISLFFSLSKVEKLDRTEIVKFYKRRCKRVLTVYVLFCIPWSILRDLIVEYDLGKFIRQLFFIDSHLNFFWFVGAILVCYLLYPPVYLLLRKRRNSTLVIGTAIYTFGLLLICKFVPRIYADYGIMLSRIPVFILGCLYAQKVYNDEVVSPKEWAGFLIPILAWKPLVLLVKASEPVAFASGLVNRLLGSICAVGAIFVILLLIVIPAVGTRLEKFLNWVSKFSLELYVFSMAFRILLLSVLHMPIDNAANVAMFSAVFVPGSIIGGFCLYSVLNFISDFFEHKCCRI